MSVEIKKMEGEQWKIVHTHKYGYERIMTLDYEEIKELIEEFKKEGF